MTLLEYILTKYLGNPTKQLGNGESYWPCPACGHRNFHSLPTNPAYKDYARCSKCRFLEDAQGVVKEFHSGAYPQWPEFTNYKVKETVFYKLKAAWKRYREEERGVKNVKHLRK